LAASGVAFDAVGDLCGLAARRDPLLKRIAASEGVKIAACFPRAVRWLFHAARSPLPNEGIDLLNMRTAGADEIAGKLLSSVGPSVCEGPAAEAPSCQCCGRVSEDVQGGAPVEAAIPRGWIPWFPVIDYDRCGNCKQCLSFCLFGVYAVDQDDRVEVRNPHQCKTNCPACARVCPSAAIVFPKYDKAPVNGDEVCEGDPRPDPVQVDVSRLFEGGAQAALRARGERARERFSIDKAGAGSSSGCDRCRKQLQADLDIPDEVLANAWREQDGPAARRAEVQPDAKSSGNGPSAQPDAWDL
jgi:NAD-dependent dihydropyrimidine dehydrogenase PreA subunit